VWNLEYSEPGGDLVGSIDGACLRLTGRFVGLTSVRDYVRIGNERAKSGVEVDSK
jgi:hypothetical protein